MQIAQLVQSKLSYKCHWSVANYLQRSARHIASATDVAQARAVGVAAVKLAVAGGNGLMPVIARTSTSPYRWKIGKVRLEDVAVRERRLPRNFISADGMQITAACRQYLAPLIAGEDFPVFQRGAATTRSAQVEPRSAPPAALRAARQNGSQDAGERGAMAARGPAFFARSGKFCL